MSFSVTGRPRVRQRALLGSAIPRVQRGMRKPVHTAYLHFLPWVLTPFMVAPVLPGDTFKNALIQGRIITTPVKSQLVGCWLETYWFYVSHRQMSMADDLVSMMIDPDFDIVQDGSGIAASADADWQEESDDIQFAREAYYAVINEFFRGEGETYANGQHSATGYNYCRLKQPGWWDSIIPSSRLVTEFGPGADSIGGTDLNQVGEISRAIDRYNQALMLGLTDLTYEDWLSMYGVKVDQPTDERRPEMLRYTREWSYPNNSVSVDSTQQRVASVFSWSLTERIDKDRHFKEPGVIIGIMLVRPKLYHDQKHAGVGMLNDYQGWQTPFQTGVYDAYRPLPELDGYHWDTRDLFLHGDQWVHCQRGTGPTALTFPTDGVFDYPADTLVNAWFNDGGTGTNGYIAADLVTNLSILSRLPADVTPRTT